MSEMSGSVEERTGPNPPDSSSLNSSGDGRIVERFQKKTIAISSLLPADSPRLSGESAEHVRALADTEKDLPPILVHGPNMRVIDGMHRLRAAVLRGEDRIAAYIFEGSAESAFVLAVKSNIEHGLPLSLRDREAAAERIIASYPQWSDRAIAEAAGLSSKTIGSLRQRTVAAQDEQVAARIGRDGRCRPVNSADGRRRASELIKDRPEASLREIAKAVGISPGTARDVRERMRRGDDPLPPTQRAVADGATSVVARAKPRVHARGRRDRRDCESILQNLKKDPSLRFTDAGRSLLRWLDTHVLDPTEWTEFVEAVPQHCTDVVADVAYCCAESWRRFAEELEDRGRSTA